MRRPTILMVDDDVAFLAAVRARLEAAGYVVEEAQDAVQATIAARRVRPDLVLLDLNLPAADGFAVCERTRRIEGLEDVPVVFLTGERSVRASYGVRASGGQAILYKPLEEGRLLHVLAEVLGDEPSVAAGERDRALAALQDAADAWSAGTAAGGGGRA